MKRLGLLVLMVFGAGSLRASDTEPSMGLILPIEEKENGVFLTQPILISGGIVAPAGSRLTLAFLIPSSDDPAMQSRSGTKESLEATFTRQPTKLASMEKDNSPAARYRAKLEQMADEVTWTKAEFFQAIFHKYNHDDFILVLIRPGETQKQLMQFDFPQGLFLGQKDDSVVILAVQNDSPGAKAGFLAGQQILSVNGTPVKGGLKGFTDAYYNAQKSSASNPEPIVFSVSAADSTESKEITIAPPRNLKTDLWSDIMSGEGQ